MIELKVEETEFKKCQNVALKYYDGHLMKRLSIEQAEGILPSKCLFMINYLGLSRAIYLDIFSYLGNELECRKCYFALITANDAVVLDGVYEEFFTAIYCKYSELVKEFRNYES